MEKDKNKQKELEKQKQRKKQLEREKQKYFEFYDDIKNHTRGQEDW